MGMAGQLEGGLSAQVHGVVHEPLQGEEKYGPGLPAARRALWRWAAVHPADDALEPAAGDIVVNGFRVDATGLQPWRVHQEAGRDRVEERFQALCS